MGFSCKTFLKSSSHDVCASNVVIACISLGVLLTLVAFFYPVDWDYSLDPDLTARENEDRRIRIVRIQTIVYSISIAGMVLVTVGGVLSAFLLTKYVLLEECVQTEEEQQPIVDKTHDNAGMTSHGVHGSGDTTIKKKTDKDCDSQLQSCSPSPSAGHQYGSVQ